MCVVGGSQASGRGDPSLSHGVQGPRGWQERVCCPHPSGLPKSGLVQHTAWSLMGQDRAAKVNRGFLPHGRGPRREFQGKPRHISFWISDGSRQNARGLPPAPFRGQDFVLLCPHQYTPHLGGRPTGAALGEVEEQTQKMKSCPHKDLNPRVHSSCIHRGPKIKQPRRPSTGEG